jgi:hypothetical protein
MMGNKLSKALGAGLPMLVLATSSVEVLGQSPIELQQLQPMPASQDGANRPSLPPARLPEAGGLIRLERFPQTAPVAAPRMAAAPMNVLPLAQEPNKTSRERSRGGKLNVKDMVSNQVDFTRILSMTEIDSVANEPAALAPMVRIQNSPSMGEYQWTPSGYCWQSPAFCYSPLYFEQPNLERYGNSAFPLLAPAVSATYFLGQVTFLPIKSLIQPPWSKSCTLGHHRPGDCAPFQRRNPHHVQATPAVSQPYAFQSEEVVSTATAIGSDIAPPANQVQVSQYEAAPVNSVVPGAEPVVVKLSD